MGVWKGSQWKWGGEEGKAWHKGNGVGMGRLGACNGAGEGRLVYIGRELGGR